MGISCALQAAIRDRRESARLSSDNVTSVLDQTVDSSAVNHAKTSFNADDLIWRAQENCIALNREKAVQMLMPVFAQLLSPAVFDAAVSNSNILDRASANFDAAVEDFIHIAKESGFSVTREYAVRKLEPFFTSPSINALPE